jgi:hypothetical protein
VRRWVGREGGPLRSVRSFWACFVASTATTPLPVVWVPRNPVAGLRTRSRYPCRLFDMLVESRGGKFVAFDGAVAGLFLLRRVCAIEATTSETPPLASVHA